MSRIFVTGDTHRTHDIAKIEPSLFLEQLSLTKNDYMIICGDVGILWSSYTKYSPNAISEDDKSAIQYWQDKYFTTLFIDGNHENHIALNSYPIEEWNGGKIHRLSDSVIHLMRGQVYTIDGKKFFTMGGADSIDKGIRTPNVSWWEDEMPSQAEYQEAMDNLEKNDFKVDYVITHDCGTQIKSRIVTVHNQHDELNQFLWHLEKTFNLQFEHWYFGHHHIDRDIDEKHTCLYNTIREIKSI